MHTLKVCSGDQGKHYFNVQQAEMLKTCDGGVRKQKHQQKKSKKIGSRRTHQFCLYVC